MLGGDTPLVISAGLPNIIGTVGDLVNQSSGNAQGAFYAFYGAHDLEAGSSGNTEKAGTTKFEAALPNVIYGNSEPVQPPAFALVPQIKY